MRHAKKVTLYTTPICHWCRIAKRYLDENGIAYREVDVMGDPEGLREMVLMTGQQGVPVLLVGGHAMVGWDEAEFRRLYELRPKRRRT